MGGGIQIENWKSGFVNSVIVSHEPENLYLFLIGKFLKKSCKNNQNLFFLKIQQTKNIYMKRQQINKLSTNEVLFLIF